MNENVSNPPSSAEKSGSLQTEVQPALWPDQRQEVAHPSVISGVLVTGGTSPSVLPPVLLNHDPNVSKALQDLLLPEALLAAKLSADCDSLEQLQAQLIAHFGQNSQETRIRYSQSVLRWFFADGISGLASRVWTAYQDEGVEKDILRYLYLVAEPLVGGCVADALYPLEEGMLIPPNYFDQYLREQLGSEALSRLTTVVSQGLADRFQRFKDASIATILKKAATEGNGSGLQELLDIIQLADADRLAGVLNDNLIAFLRKVLYDENLVDEQIFLGPILQQVGPIEETRVDEAVSTLTRLLTRAVKDAKAKYGASKRVRVFLTLDSPSIGSLEAGLRPGDGDAE